MRIAIITTYTHPSRTVIKERSAMQSSVPELIASFCPPDATIELYNEKEAEIPLDENWDLVFFSYLHAFYEHTKVLSTLLRKRGIKTVAGGRHVNAFPEDTQKYFDAIVLGYPESNLPALFKDFEKHNLKKVYNIKSDSISGIRPYQYNLIDYKTNKTRFPGIEASRGCPFKCDFCVLTGKEEYKYRPVKHVVNEIKCHMKWNPNFFGRLKNIFGFLDNNLGGSVSYLKALCEELIPLKTVWGCSLTFNILRNEELVKLMAKAGCRYIYTGIESLNPDTLKGMNKEQNKIAETKKIIQRCYNNGIVLTFGIIVGADGDTNEYLVKLPDILSDLGSFGITYMGIACPYPDTPFFHKIQTSGRLLPGITSRDLDGYTVCHQPTSINPDEVADHFKRLSIEVPSLPNITRYHLNKIFDSSLPGYKTILAGTAREVFSLRRNVMNPKRTYLAGKDPIEEWDEKMMKELNLEPQQIKPQPELKAAAG